MITFLKPICIIAAIFSGVLTTSVQLSERAENMVKLSETTVAAPAEAIVPPCPDDEPILMRTRVKDTDGGAISGVYVTLTKPGLSTPSYSGTTDSNGDCQFNSVIVGPYTLGLSKTGYIPKSIGLNLTVNTYRNDTLLTQ